MSHKKTIERWEKMANADLGSWVQPEAKQWAVFFEKAAEAEANGLKQFNIHGLDLIIPALRGFSWKNPDLLSITTTLNLCHVTLEEEYWAIDTLDCWLMDKKGWLERYQLTLSLKGKNFKLKNK